MVEKLVSYMQEIEIILISNDASRCTQITYMVWRGKKQQQPEKGICSFLFFHSATHNVWRSGTHKVCKEPEHGIDLKFKKPLTTT